MTITNCKNIAHTLLKNIVVKETPQFQNRNNILKLKFESNLKTEGFNSTIDGTILLKLKTQSFSTFFDLKIVYEDNNTKYKHNIDGWDNNEDSFFYNSFKYEMLLFSKKWIEENSHYSDYSLIKNIIENELKAIEDKLEWYLKTEYLGTQSQLSILELIDTYFFQTYYKRQTILSEL